MSNYVKTKVHLSDHQINKLKTAHKKKEEVTLQINTSKAPNHDLYLTQTQIEQLKKGKRIKISKTQLEKNGGFLPFLIPILTTLATGALSGAAGWGAKKIMDKVSGSGCKGKKKKGKGVLQNWESRTN